MKKTLIALLSIVLVFSLCACGESAPSNSDRYAEACQLKTNGQYAEAQAIFDELGTYEDSAAQAQECAYQNGCQLMDQGQYAEARVIFEELGTYEDSADKIKECNYNEIDALLQGDWRASHAIGSVELITTYTFDDGRFHVAMELSGTSSPANEGDYRIDTDAQEIYVCYDFIYSISFSGGDTTATPNTEEQLLFTYTYEDGIFVLTDSNSSIAEKQ